jgi:hypothetical protein
MRKLSIVFFRFILVLIVPGLVACTKSTPDGPVQVQIPRPVLGEHCKYEFGNVRLETLASLSEMRGTVGRVLTTRQNLDSKPEVLQQGESLQSVDVDFTQSGDTFYPTTNSSVFAAALYHAIETGYLLTRQIDPSKDLASLVPNFADTRIVLNAKRSTDGKGRGEEYDNAEYLPVEVINGSNRLLLNYFFAYPTSAIRDIPLGVNMGIMVHEFSHLVMQHLFWESAQQKNYQVVEGKPTEQTLAALDEGMADYLGYLATKDSGFFLCSFPSEDRDLAVPKSFTPEVVERLGIPAQKGFDPHEGGAVWANIQYEIGAVIGHEANGKALLDLMSSLIQCPGVLQGTNAISIDFGDVASCHTQLLSKSVRDTSTVRAIYQKHLGAYGGRL